jgi:hypothetical protein
MKRPLASLLLALFALSGTPAAFAHAASTSFLSLDASSQDGPVAVRWDMSLQDLVWTVFIDADVDGVATWGEIEAARPAIGTAVLGQLSIDRGDAACELSVRDFALAHRLEQNFLSIALEARCPRPGALHVAGPLFMAGDASQRVLLSATRGAQKLPNGAGPAGGHRAEVTRRRDGRTSANSGRTSSASAAAGSGRAATSTVPAGGSAEAAGAA